MHIQLEKFGKILVSRPSGKEAYLAFRPSLRNIGVNEDVIVDFNGVEVITPSWADEFLSPLYRDYKNNNITLINTTNASVIETLKIIGLATKSSR